MKFAFAFKHLLAATAFVLTSAAGAAGYDWTVTSGYVLVNFSDEAANVLSAGGIRIVTPANILGLSGLPNAGSANTASYSRPFNLLSLTPISGVIDGDSIKSIQTSGNLVELRRFVVEDDENITVKSALLTNLEFDFNTATLYANLYERRNNLLVTSLGKLAIFTASQSGVTGGTSGHAVLDSVDSEGNATGHVSGSFSGQLHISPENVNSILTSLGLSTDESGALNYLIRNADWGTVSFSAGLAGTPAVPEPSSYALIGAGLAALCLMKRKRI